ncbi:hypothetical protein [Phytomonospora endophytica]|nr:hypothetical protein [Phytomonospora endophytica]
MDVEALFPADRGAFELVEVGAGLFDDAAGVIGMIWRAVFWARTARKS